MKVRIFTTRGKDEEIGHWIERNIKKAEGAAAFALGEILDEVSRESFRAGTRNAYRQMVEHYKVKRKGK